MSNSLLREARKLEVRLENFVKEEESFIETLRRFIDEIKELDVRIEEAGEKGSERLKETRLEIFKLFSEVLRKQSEAEHERSHLLESYGSLLLALDEKFRVLKDEETSNSL